MNRRRPWLAGVLALAFPGLGHLYLGRVRSALLWSCIDVTQGVRNRCQRLNRRDHILLISAVVADTGNFLVSTVAKISAPALAAGAVEEANAMLGREYAVRGTVVHGAGRGRVLGYPTLNIATPSDRQLPADGIYAMRIAVGAEVLAAAANLGVRPTFETSGARLLEAYLLDVTRELYGALVEARFVKRIRTEQKFSTAEELTAQIARDVCDEFEARDGRY